MWWQSLAKKTVKNICYRVIIMNVEIWHNLVVLLFCFVVWKCSARVVQRKEWRATFVTTQYSFVVRSRRHQRHGACSRLCAHSMSATLLSMKAFASSLKFSTSWMWTRASSPTDFGIFQLWPYINGRLWRRPALTTAIAAAITARMSEYFICDVKNLKRWTVGVYIQKRWFLHPLKIFWKSCISTRYLVYWYQ